MQRWKESNKTVEKAAAGGNNELTQHCSQNATPDTRPVLEEKANVAIKERSGGMAEYSRSSAAKREL